MTTLSVTGHMDLTDETVELVRSELRKLLAEESGPGLVGVSCIAKGSDSIFAEELLAVGGRLVVVIPSQDYRSKKVKPDHVDRFDRLVEAADEVLVMPHESANRQAYESANEVLLSRADRFVAVWDGVPPTGKGGGTADVVEAARARGLAVAVVWPEEASRKG